MDNIDYSSIQGLLGDLTQEQKNKLLAPVNDFTSGGLLGYLHKIHPELNFSGGGGNGMIYGGGRIGANFPILDATGRLGVSGGGAYGNGIKDFTVDRVDAGIKSGNLDVGVDASPNDPIHNWLLRIKYGF